MGTTENNPLKLKMTTTCPIIDSNWKKIILSLSHTLSVEIHQALLEIWQPIDFFELDSTDFTVRYSTDHLTKSVSLNQNNRIYSLSLKSQHNFSDSHIELIFSINGNKSLSFEFVS